MSINYEAEAKNIARSLVDSPRQIYFWQVRGAIEQMNQYAPFEKEKLIPLVEEEFEELQRLC